MNQNEKYRKVLESLEVPSSKTTEQAWDELSLRLDNAPVRNNVIRIRRVLWTSVAAAAVFVAIVLVINNPRSNTFSIAASNGEIKKVTLPDGSETLVNAGSSIVFETDWSDERSLSLEGEAFFEVKPGSRFTVNTVYGSVEVLGTSFNVFARPEKFEVECRTGKVRVKSGDNEITIEPGESVALSETAFVPETFDPQGSDWYDGEIVYTDEPLLNVFKEIERQFNVKVKAPDVTGRIFTGSINNKNLRESLDIMCLAMDLNYEVQTDMTVLIRKKD